MAAQSRLAAACAPGRVLWFVVMYPRLGVAQRGAVCLGVVVVDLSDAETGVLGSVRQADYTGVRVTHQLGEPLRDRVRFRRAVGLFKRWRGD